jgi:hypothetical protein
MRIFEPRYPPPPPSLLVQFIFVNLKKQKRLPKRIPTASVHDVRKICEIPYIAFVLSKFRLGTLHERYGNY